MNKINLDKKDIQILGILDWNARMPLTQIAKKIRLNKDVVRYRINNLEKNGVIEGYYTVINTSKLGYITIRVYLDFINVNNVIEKKIINYLNKNFNASQIFSIEGEYQLGIIAWEKSIFDLDRKMRDFKKLFGNYINKEQISIITLFNQYPRKFLLDNKQVIKIEESELFKIKEDDLRILSEISKNSRVSSVDLSFKLKIPQTTIIHRIKELEKAKIILGYRVKINISKLDYQNYFIEIYTKNNSEVNKIIDFSIANKNCIYSLNVFPGADLELETEFTDKLELFDFINHLRNSFKSIKKIKYWSTINYHNINYFPQKVEEK